LWLFLLDFRSEHADDVRVMRDIGDI